jgi:hypothetical protein
MSTSSSSIFVTWISSADVRDDHRQRDFLDWATIRLVETTHRATLHALGRPVSIVVSSVDRSSEHFESRKSIIVPERFRSSQSTCVGTGTVPVVVMTQCRTFSLCSSLGRTPGMLHSCDRSLH